MRNFQDDLEEKTIHTCSWLRVKVFQEGALASKVPQLFQCLVQFLKHLKMKNKKTKQTYTSLVNVEEIQTYSLWCEFLEELGSTLIQLSISLMTSVSPLEKSKGGFWKTKCLMSKPNLFDLDGTTNMRTQKSFLQLINHISLLENPPNFQNSFR